MSFIPIFFFNDTATTEIYTLSLHDALPICRLNEEPREVPLYPRVHRREFRRRATSSSCASLITPARCIAHRVSRSDRKSTRLNSSHANISYAVFCLKKKKNQLFIKLTITHL